MIKLALLGRNIQHSKSPEIYRSLISNEIQYDLLDIENANEIPSVEELFLKYDGVSITSPYKKHYLPDVELTNQAEIVGAINCLKIKNGIITGGNTDLLAIANIIENWIEKFGHLNIIILGDGVMSHVTQYALIKYNTVSFKVLSRKKTDNFGHLNLSEFFENHFPNKYQKLIINTCSRDYLCKNRLDSEIIFWDYNYNFDQHFKFLSPSLKQYIDGLSMLKLQAQYALEFWSITSTDINS